MQIRLCSGRARGAVVQESESAEQVRVGLVLREKVRKEARWRDGKDGTVQYTGFCVFWGCLWVCVGILSGCCATW